MYRDELTTASQRIDALQDQLDAQNKELVALRQLVAKRISGGPAPSRRRGVVILSAGIALGATIAWFAAHAEPNEVVQAPEPAPSQVQAPPASGIQAYPTDGRSNDPSTRRTPRSSDPGFRVDVADAVRVEALASRCTRTVPRTSMDGLPRGTRVLDFMTCFGCDCCLPGGEFPPAFDENSKPVPSTGECRQCSRRRTLEDAGLAVLGGRDDDPLRGTHGLVFNLVRPARVFALHVAGGGYQVTKEPLPDHGVSLIAYDENGRPIDGARATYPSSKPDHSMTDFSALERVLLVEACNGERIGRVDLGSSNMNLQVKAIAVLASDAK